jgi:hypothetical protein
MTTGQFRIYAANDFWAMKARGAGAYARILSTHLAAGF